MKSVLAKMGQAFSRSEADPSVRGAGPLADVAKHVGVDVEANIGHVVDMLAGDQPDNLADLTLGVIAGQTGKSLRVNPLVPGQLGDIVQCCAFRVGEEGMGAVLGQGVELGLVHGALDCEVSANVDAEEADVDMRYLLADQHDGLCRQQKLLVQLADLSVELTEADRQSRGKYLERREYLAELAAGHRIHQPHDQAFRLLNGRKEGSFGLRAERLRTAQLCLHGHHLTRAFVTPAPAGASPDEAGQFARRYYYDGAEGYCVTGIVYFAGKVR